MVLYWPRPQAQKELSFEHSSSRCGDGTCPRETSIGSHACWDARIVCWLRRPYMRCESSCSGQPLPYSCEGDQSSCSSLKTFPPKHLRSEVWWDQKQALYWNMHTAKFTGIPTSGTRELLRGRWHWQCGHKAPRPLAQLPHATACRHAGASE